MNTIDYLKCNKLTGDNSTISDIQADFEKYGIKVSYSPEEDNRVVIFSSYKYHRNSTKFDKFISECNGLILKAKSWEPLVIPPRTFRSNLDVNTMNKYIQNNKYNIFKVQDGTMISLYYFNSKWRISTSNGFDVTELKWNNRLFGEVVDDLLKEKYDNTKDFYDSLDKTNCYTLCIVHPDFHPFYKTLKNNKKIYFIQMVDLFTGNVIKKNPFPKNKILDQVLSTPVKNIQTVFKPLAKALTKYIRTNNICFGYIFRLKDDTKIDDISYSNIFLESSLLRNIRIIMYNKYTKHKNNKFEYIAVNTFLKPNLRNKFIALFPQFIKLFNNLENISDKLIKSISNIQLNNIFPKDDPQLLTISKQIHKNLNLQITDHSKFMELYYKISQNIYNPKYTNSFYKLLY